MQDKPESIARDDRRLTIVNRNGFSRWFWLILSIPAGFFFGFIGSYYVCLGILLLLGKGQSRNDLDTILDAGVVGALIGAAVFPIYIYRRKKEQ